MRPIRPLGPMLAATVAVAGWWLVAHSSGQGWVQALGDLVFGALLVGVVGPAVHLAFGRPAIVSAPADGQAGRPVEVVVRSGRRVRMRPLDPAGEERFAGPSPGGLDSQLVLLPDRRGVHRSIRVEMASAAPFGLQWWARTVTLELAAPLYVAPRPGRSHPVPTADRDTGGGPGSPRAAATGDLRAPRPYRPGDQRRHVHWPASAHSGQVMVRDLERPVGEPVELTVVLPEDPDEAESAAERALGTVLALLADGRPTILATREEDGPVRALVADRRSAGRRLAAAR